MIVKIFSIRDAKAEAYMQPFMMQTRGQAIRSFGDHARDVSSQVSKHPEDYALFEIGEFDDNAGIIKPNLTPIHIADADSELQR